VNIIRTGIFCLGLCALAAAQDLAELQQIDPVTGKPVQGQPPSPTQQPPATPPPAETAAPAQQSPPRVSPVAPPEDQTPVTPAAPTGPNITVAPELPKYPDVRMPGEAGWSLGVSVWVPKEHPTFNRGRAAIFPQPSLITMQGTPKYSDGADLGIAVGLHNTLRVSWFNAKAAGNYRTPQDITLWNQTYLAGTDVSTNYTVQNFKLSFDYLTWPYPVESRRFRLLTLWQLQYT